MRNFCLVKFLKILLISVSLTGLKIVQASSPGPAPHGESPVQKLLAPEKKLALDKIRAYLKATTISRKVLTLGCCKGTFCTQRVSGEAHSNELTLNFGTEDGHHINLDVTAFIQDKEFKAQVLRIAMGQFDEIHNEDCCPIASARHAENSDGLAYLRFFNALLKADGGLYLEWPTGCGKDTTEEGLAFVKRAGFKVAENVLKIRYYSMHPELKNSFFKKWKSLGLFRESSTSYALQPPYDKPVFWSETCHSFTSFISSKPTLDQLNETYVKIPRTSSPFKDGLRCLLAARSQVLTQDKFIESKTAESLYSGFKLFMEEHPPLVSSDAACASYLEETKKKLAEAETILATPASPESHTHLLAQSNLKHLQDELKILTNPNCKYFLALKKHDDEPLGFCSKVIPNLDIQYHFLEFVCTPKFSIFVK